MANAKVTLGELQTALDGLIARDVPPPLGPDEFTVMMVKKRGHVNHDTATNLVAAWEAAGEAVSVGKRRSGSQVVDAWKVVKK